MHARPVDFRGASRTTGDGVPRKQFAVFTTKDIVGCVYQKFCDVRMYVQFGDAAKMAVLTGPFIVFVIIIDAARMAVLTGP